MFKRIRTMALVASIAALAPFAASMAPTAQTARAVDPHCKQADKPGPLFTMRTRAGGATNPVAKPQVTDVTGQLPVPLPGPPAGLPIVLPPEAQNPQKAVQGGIDTAWSGNVTQPGAQPTDYFNRMCYVSIQASDKGPMPNYPHDVRQVEPGTQFSVFYGKHYSVSSWSIRVRWVGDTTIKYDATTKGVQSCFLGSCGGYDTGWIDLVIPPHAVGYFETLVTDPTGTTHKGCFATFRSNCPA